MISKGFKHSPETRAKMSAAHRGHGVSPETRAKMVGNKHAWKGGRHNDAKGYIRACCPDHPFADAKGYVLEHRLVMGAFLGRPLLSTEVVHHINGIRDDNRIENLMRFDSRSDHVSWHHQNEKEEES